MTSPWEEPVRGGHPDPSLLGLPGIDQLRAMLDGRVPRPPISHLTGMMLTEIGTGSARTEATHIASASPLPSSNVFPTRALTMM